MDVPYLVEVAAEYYGFIKSECRFMAYGRENSKQMYSFGINGEPYILRVTKCASGHLGQIKAEMDWLLYLCMKGANVPSPLRTLKGELAFSAQENGDTYVISAFSKVRGNCWNKEDPKLWNKDVFYNWGKAVGEMHRLSKDYKPAAKAEKRGGFDLRGMVNENIKAFPSISRIADGLLCEIEALPKDRDSYGMIHNDLHPGNFFIDGEQIHLFDFDGCAYSWYAFDIGNALFISLWLARRNHAGVDFTNDIIRYFLKGYLSENTLNHFWLSQIPSFMMLCKISLFSYGCSGEDPDNEKGCIENIEKGILFSGCKVDDSLFKAT